jgi:hypothetical protein
MPRRDPPDLTAREVERLTTRDMVNLMGGGQEGLTMKMLFLVLGLATIVDPACAQDGHIPGLDKPTDGTAVCLSQLNAGPVAAKSSTRVDDRKGRRTGD